MSPALDRLVAHLAEQYEPVSTLALAELLGFTRSHTLKLLRRSDRVIRVGEQRHGPRGGRPVALWVAS